MTATMIDSKPLIIANGLSKSFKKVKVINKAEMDKAKAFIAETLAGRTK